MPLVGVVMGSRSDEDVVQETAEVLEQLGVDHEVVAMSAHRTPDKVREYAQSARDRGIEVLIGAAGGSAALPGVLASWSTVPVIGIPLASSEMNGVDSLYTIAQMPPGIPVACVAIGVGRAERGVSRRTDTWHQARLHPTGLRRLPRGTEEPLTHTAACARGNLLEGVCKVLNLY